jgi:hypothetical protein
MLKVRDERTVKTFCAILVSGLLTVSGRLENEYSRSDLGLPKYANLNQAAAGRRYLGCSPIQRNSSSWLTRLAPEELYEVILSEVELSRSRS